MMYRYRDNPVGGMMFLLLMRILLKGTVVVAMMMLMKKKKRMMMGLPAISHTIPPVLSVHSESIPCYIQQRGSLGMGGVLLLLAPVYPQCLQRIILLLLLLL